MLRLRYLVEEPVDLHTHRLGEKLPAAVQLRLVQLLPGELELLVCERQRHDGFHPAPTPASAAAAAATTVKHREYQHASLPVQALRE